MSLPGRVLVISPTPTWPLDHGNRKRVHQIASALKERGHEIHFLYYPAEFDWEQAIPHRAWQAMQRQWDSVHLVPVTRPLHARARDDHHAIDEWWDDALGSYLDWLFSVERFDAVLVNYIWLSRAFEHVPPGVTRLVDTHDRMGGRKELLASLGLPPQFFYTTPEVEFRALERADIALAIKEEEARAFRAGCATSVEIVTLPYVEPNVPARRPERVGPLRLGLMGASNSLNRISTRALLDLLLARPMREDAPWHVVIGGALSEDFHDLADPRVTVMGRVNDIADFYAAIDCLVMPLAQSTGQKIRVGEALAHDMPIVAHTHAFEGYPPADPMHGLADMPAIVAAIEDLAADSARLTRLARASARSRAIQDMLVQDGIDRIEGQILDARPTFIVAARDAVLRNHGLSWHRLGAVVAMLARRGRVLVWAEVDGPPDGLTRNRLSVLAKRARLVLPPALADEMEGAMVAGQGGLDACAAWVRPACVWGPPGLKVAGMRMVHDADLADGPAPGASSLWSGDGLHQVHAPLMLEGPGTTLWRVDDGRPVVWVVGSAHHRALLPDIALALAPWIDTPLVVWGMDNPGRDDRWQTVDKARIGLGLDRPHLAILLEPEAIENSLALDLAAQAGCGCVIYDPAGAGRHPAVAPSVARLLGWLRLAAATWPVEGMRRPRTIPLFPDRVEGRLIDRLVGIEG